MTTDTVAKEAVDHARRLVGRRDGQGGGDAGARPGHDAGGDHHRRRGRPEHAARPARRGRRVSFDRVDSDGCMSTNDTVLLLSSGASGVDPGAGRADRPR